MTFLPAISTVSQNLPAYIHKEHTLSGRSKKYGIFSTSEKKTFGNGNTSIISQFSRASFCLLKPPLPN
jgi:hypothetical protein